MPDCPFCGEEISDTDQNCGRCGAELKTDELAVGEEEAGPLPEPGEIKSCPRCDALLPKKAFRCNECGNKFDDFEVGGGNAAWKLGAWGVVLAVVAAAVLGFIYFAASRRTEAPKEYVSDTFKLLDSLAGRRGRNEARRGDTWRRVEGKYVTWEGKVTARDESLIAIEFLVKIDPKYRKKLPDVRVVFPLHNKEEVEHYERGDKIRFTARLKELVNDDVVFLLDNAELAEAEKPKPPEKVKTPAPAPSEGG